MSDEENRYIHHILSQILQAATGQVLLPNRQWRIESALKPVMTRNSIPDLSVLVELLAKRSDKALETECVDAMLNNETSFFRDQPNFALLTGPVLDFVREQKMGTKVVRIWCNACSTGQEPYSLAMSFAQNQEKWAGWRIEIIATDVSKTALERAKSGLYSQFEIQRGLPVMFMLRYFDQVATDWQIKESIRKMVDFKLFNSVQRGGGFGQFDIILCRNMLMYLGDESKTKILDNLSEASHEHTLLMLGAAETVIGQTDKFVASRDFRGFYEKARSTSVLRPVAQRQAF
jgi:chemotaxis protein methyltransferase CheR